MLYFNFLTFKYYFKTKFSKKVSNSKPTKIILTPQ